MSLLVKYFSFLSCLILTLHGNEDAPLLALGMPVPLALESETIEMDGMSDTFYVLSGGGFRTKWLGQNTSWAFNKNPGYPASLSLEDRRADALKMELFVYPPNSSAKQLSDSLVESYRATVEASFAKPLKVTCLNPESARPTRGYAPFLGNTYRIFQFEILPSENAGPEEAFLLTDYLTITDDAYVLVLRFRGPRDLMERFGPRMPKELIRFSQAD